jgi:F-type H+-transporting ATPase subunit b
MVACVSLIDFEGTILISLDGSIIPALIIFIVLIAALNSILFKPLARVQADRESRTTGMMAQAQEKIKNQLNLFNKYQASIKNARMEGYRRQEQLRGEAMQKRAEVLAEARKAAELKIKESREVICEQVETAKEQLARDAEEIARKITATVLERSAADAGPT